MKSSALLCSLLFILAPAFAADPAYKIGDRLVPPDKSARADYREVSWDDLMPKDWDPMAAFKGIDFSKLKDSDPKAIEALDRLKNAWSAAPIVPALDGQKLRLPGFVVPLEKKNGKTTEFLLVPYFGACIHTPPPPLNQIVHVVPAQAVSVMSMDTIWVNGTMRVARHDTELGSAGYRMEAIRVEPYVEAVEKAKRR